MFGLKCSIFNMSHFLPRLSGSRATEYAAIICSEVSTLSRLRRPPTTHTHTHALTHASTRRHCRPRNPVCFFRYQRAKRLLQVSAAAHTCALHCSQSNRPTALPLSVPFHVIVCLQREAKRRAQLEALGVRHVTSRHDCGEL